MHRLHVHIKGVVQGVGFRPFVHSLARRFDLAGWVINDSRGVEIEVAGPIDSLRAFARALRDEPPPLAQIVSIDEEYAEIDDAEGRLESLPHKFEIRRSVAVEGERVLISPDIAVCDDCLREMYDPGDRRYRYPFLNCTNCGPRFTIIEDLPYDRPKTTMREFPMCEKCASEYENPENRRYHAQPTCCADCGPSLRFLDAHGHEIEGDPIQLAIEKLRDGQIVAVKGIGGFHLACDATNAGAVRRLRERKHREAKPLAIMVSGIGTAKTLGFITDDAAKALLSPARPIVIIPLISPSPLGPIEKMRAGFVGQTFQSASPQITESHGRLESLPHKTNSTDSGIPLADGSMEGVTGGLNTVGIMLPYTPIHHLLFRPLPINAPVDRSTLSIPEEIGGPPGPDADAFAALVMTSGNISDEPIAAENEEALERLGGIADAFLVHDRKIHRRADDSVATVRDGVTAIWRWGRGHVPRPIFLPESLPPVLGVGGELKSTICHIRDDKAFVSPHIGDLKTYETFEFLRETIEHQGRILDVQPEYVACDMHPDYHSTRWAEEESGLPVTKVQHHHAHVVALLAEHDMLDHEILALAMDGTGYGTDGAIWGSEIMRASTVDFTRLGHFTYAPLPGGDVAIREVWRTALGRLQDESQGLPEEFRPLFSDASPDTIATVEGMIRADVNCPQVDSLGRLFDAAAFIAGLGPVAQFDGQFPMLLEAACGASIELPVDAGEFDIERLFIEENGKFLVDGSAILRDLARRRLQGESTENLAKQFHRSVVLILERAAIIAREKTGIDIIGLTGGCFMNRILHEELKPRLENDRFRVLTHRIMPTNDGCISLGQALSVACRIKRGKLH